MKDKMEFLRQLHDKSGHRGRDGTYEKLRLCYYLDGLYCDINRYIRSCEESQKLRPHRYAETLHPMFSGTVLPRLDWTSSTCPQ